MNVGTVYNQRSSTFRRSLMRKSIVGCFLYLLPLFSFRLEHIALLSDNFLHVQGLAATLEFHNVARKELFCSPRLHLSIEEALAGLNDHLCLPARTDGVGESQQGLQVAQDL